MVSVTGRMDGHGSCDKLKVCEAGVDPWRKLSNVAFVFVDRTTRVVLGHQFVHLDGAPLERLIPSWGADPDFDRPDLFIEARDGPDGSRPAYYVSARWLAEVLELPPATPMPSAEWARLRRDHARRDPLITVVEDDFLEGACPRCGAPIRITRPDSFRDRGSAELRHGLPLGEECGIRGHLVVASRWLPTPLACSEERQRAGVESRVSREIMLRLADLVPEPEDHGH
jgi:hypothetical protein